MENSEYLASITMDELNNMIKELSILQTYKKTQNKACRSYYERNKEKIKEKSKEYHKKIKEKNEYMDDLAVLKRREYSKKHYYKNRDSILEKKKQIRDNVSNAIFLDNLNANI